MAVQGSCLCGAVRFEMTGTPIGVNHCHCSRCRKARGTANATNLFLRLDGFSYLSGSELITEFKPKDAKRFTHAFCKVCGASMPRIDEARGIAIIPMGAFDEDPGARPQRHIFVASKAAWDEISDELPQFPEAPPPMF